MVWLKGVGREKRGRGSMDGERACEKENWSEEGRREFVREFGIRAEVERGVEGTEEKNTGGDK